MPLPKKTTQKKVESSPEASNSEDEETETKKTSNNSEPRSPHSRRFELVTEGANDDDEDEFVGVIRASSQTENKHTLELEEGTIKNLAHMFQNINHSCTSKKPFKMDIDENEGEIVLESTPTERIEGVVRAADPSEWQKPIDVKRGTTKNLASRFLNKTTEEVKKRPFVMDIDQNAETVVLESEPVVLEGVVRSSDKAEEIQSKKGRIKNLAKGFVSLAEEINEKTLKKEVNTSRTVSERWKNSQINEEGKLREKIQLDAASEFGVYENEPEVREGVVRANEDQPDVIHVKHTRNLKKMWCQFEKNELEKEKKAKNPELIVKKKEPSPPPPPKEPTPPPKEEPKKKSWASRKKEADKTPKSPVAEQNNFQKPSLRSTARKRF